MSGYKGLGISKKVITESSGGIYQLQLSDVIDGGTTIREEFLNKTVICKTSVTNDYIAIFMTNIGKDGDTIIFKNVSDVGTEDTSYLEFYDENWDGQIFIPATWGLWIEHDNIEIMFVKEGDKWRNLKSTGIMGINDDNNPQFANKDPYFTRSIRFKNYMAFLLNPTNENFNDTQYFALGNDRVTFHKDIIPITNLTSLGDINFRFVNVFAQNFIGDGSQLTNLPSSGISKLQDDLNPILAAVLDAAFNSITNVEQLDVNTINLLTGFMSNLEMQYNNITNVEQLDVNTLQVLTGLMGNLDVAFNNLLNVEQLDVNTLNVLTGMMGNLEMQFNKITGLAAPTNPNDAATKQYVDDNAGGGGGLTKLEDDLTPKLGGDLIFSNVNDPNSKKILGVYDIISVFNNSSRILFVNHDDGKIILNISRNNVSKLYTQGLQVGSSDVGNDATLELWDNTKASYLSIGAYAGMCIFTLAGEFLPTLIIEAASISAYTNEQVDLGKDANRFKTLYAKNADFTDGATGSFTSNDGKTITVTNGLITGIV